MGKTKSRQKYTSCAKSFRKLSGLSAKSRQNAIKESAGALIDEKEAAEDLGDILRYRCHSMRVSLYRQGRLQRQKEMKNTECRPGLAGKNTF
jgi:hypothetical protein